MNIFLIDYSPVKCAQALDDLRLNKMIVETAQMLSTAARFHGVDYTCLYRSTHVNHPWTIWVSENRSNYKFALELLKAYIAERTDCRVPFSGTHKTAEILPELETAAFALPEGPLNSAFPKCFYPAVSREMPAFEGYRETLRIKWDNDLRKPQWKNRGCPGWYIPNCVE